VGPDYVLPVADSFSIVQVTPYAWEAGHEVNLFVERASEELAARGHRVLPVARRDPLRALAAARPRVAAARSGSR
jgi:hypothetical protein